MTVKFLVENEDESLEWRVVHIIEERISAFWMPNRMEDMKEDCVCVIIDGYKITLLQETELRNYLTKRFKL